MDKVSSGILSLDIVLGGGFPLNKISEISGPPDSSKTTLMLNLIKNNPDCVTAYLDTDKHMNYDYLETININTESMIISQPESAEQLLDIVEQLLNARAVDIIIIDSLANLVSKEELETSMKSKQVNNNIITKTVQKLAAMAYKSDCAIILINQIRANLKEKWGKTISIADRALNSYATIRLDIKQTNELHKYDQIIGSRLKISVVKNKINLAQGIQFIKINHYYNNGLDTTADLLDLACEAAIINKAGSWFNYGNIKLQGKDNMIDLLDTDLDLFSDILNKVVEYYNL